MKSLSNAIALSLGLLTINPLAATQQGTPVRPGFNLFSPDQDIEIGRQSAAQVEREIPIVRDSAIDEYVRGVGRRLAAVAPGPKFPYQFEVTNLSEVNAFALPGGFMFVNRGLIELVPTEGQLAGVMAHEIAHVALRHQTNQVTKAYLARAGVGILGGILAGSNRGGPGIIQVMGGLGLNALFLKFSRTAESQADIVGAQIMRRAGYDPAEMADMFELLRKQAGHDPGRLDRFLSDHPSPTDREARVRQEAARLGHPAAVGPVGDIVVIRREFRNVPAAVSMKQIGRDAAPAPGPAGTVTRIEPPSARFKTFQQHEGVYTLDYPENWQVHNAENGFGVTILPAGGAVDAGGGNLSVICGAIVNHYDPQEGTINGRSAARRPSSSSTSLEDETNGIVQQITEANSYLRIVRDSARRSAMDGHPAIVLVLAGISPVTGQEERVTVLTRLLADGHVLYALLIAPGHDASTYSGVFEHVMASLRVRPEALHSQ